MTLIVLSDVNSVKLPASYPALPLDYFQEAYDNHTTLKFARILCSCDIGTAQDPTVNKDITRTKKINPIYCQKQ